jgi:N-acetylmuramoyl-L-alanine amidase
MLTDFCKTTGIPSRRICFEERDIIKEVVRIPAIVFECAFVSNPEDEAFLCKDNNLEIIAYGIQNGIIKYFEND